MSELGIHPGGDPNMIPEAGTEISDVERERAAGEFVDAFLANPEMAEAERAQLRDEFQIKIEGPPPHISQETFIVYLYWLVTALGMIALRNPEFAEYFWDAESGLNQHLLMHSELKNRSLGSRILGIMDALEEMGVDQPHDDSEYGFPDN